MRIFLYQVLAAVTTTMLLIQTPATTKAMQLSVDAGVKIFQDGIVPWIDQSQWKSQDKKCPTAASSSAQAKSQTETFKEASGTSA